jgi:hypothetical protein
MAKGMKIIKITSILVTIITVSVIFLPAVSGADNAKAASKTPQYNNNILKRFHTANAAKESAKEDVSPLVKEAKAYALILDPPPPPVVTPPVQSKNPEIPSQTIGPITTPASGLVKLLATCVNESNPEQSLALVDLPGEGLKWVRPSGKAGQLTIKEIKPGTIVVADSQRSYNISVEPRPAEPSIVKGESATPFSTAVSTSSVPAIPAGRQIAPTTTASRPGITRTPPSARGTENVTPSGTQPVSPPARKPVSAEEKAKIQKFFSQFNIAGSEEQSVNNNDEMIKKSFNSTKEGKTANDDTKEVTNTTPKSDVNSGSDDPNSARRQPPSRRPVPPK